MKDLSFQNLIFSILILFLIICLYLNFKFGKKNKNLIIDAWINHSGLVLDDKPVSTKYVERISAPVIGENEFNYLILTEQEPRCKHWIKVDSRLADKYHVRNEFLGQNCDFVCKKLI